MTNRSAKLLHCTPLLLAALAWNPPTRWRKKVFMRESSAIGVSEDAMAEPWQRLEGNYILRPPPGMRSRAVIHFLGGSFFGAAPHVMYQYLLQGLANQGYVICATPFSLGFDYLEECDCILRRFDAAAVHLASEYGAVPVVGMGHSCGALLQVLITTLFPDAPRAANCLISFNTKPVWDAIPGLSLIVRPAAEVVMAETPEALAVRRLVGVVRDLAEAKLRQAATGQLPLEGVFEALYGARSKATPGPSSARGGSDGMTREDTEAQADAVARVVAHRARDFRDALAVVDQVPPLLRTIASGESLAFTPSPEGVKAACQALYRARRSLLVQFEGDAWDESDELEGLILKAGEVMQIQRPNITDFDVRRVVIPRPANHFTPLVQDVLGPASLVEFVPAALDPLGLERKLQSALVDPPGATDHGATTRRRPRAGRLRGDAFEASPVAPSLNADLTSNSNEPESVRRRLLEDVGVVRDALLVWLAEVTNEKQYDAEWVRQ